MQINRETATPLRPLEVPLKIVGGNQFGRYSKISDEQTTNMIVSDGFLVPYAGYEVVAALSSSGIGRAIYVSDQWNRMIAVIGNSVYALSPPGANGQQLSSFLIGRINTFEGDVFIDENIAGQIAICDGDAIWIYNWKNPSNPALIEATLPIDPVTSQVIIPQSISYQDGYFLTVNRVSASWFLSAPNNGLVWDWGLGDLPVTTTIQSKPTNAVAVKRVPSQSGWSYIMGGTVVEPWQNVGAKIFPYQRSQSVSIDYGCLSPNTIAAMDTYMVWLGSNERSGPVIMVSDGGNIDKLSNDGIDFKLATVVSPSESTGFFFKQDGHLFYQLTFYNPNDNFSLVYDFNTKLFFNVTDQNMNFHIAAAMAFFGNDYYFVSLVDGNVYRMTPTLNTYDYRGSLGGIKTEYEIQRQRICPPIRLADSSRFVIKNLVFTMEQGNDPNFIGINPNLDPQPYVPRVDMCLSKDGGTSFGSFISKDLNPQGKRKNMVRFWQLGSANDLTVQFRFWSKFRTVATDGIVNIYQ